MGIVVVSVIVLLAVAGIAYLVFVVLGARASAAAADTDADASREVEALRYDVPDGQDPAVLLTALRRAGYDADSDLVEGSTTVVVPCPAGVDHERARVREVIAEASRATLEGPRFDPGHVTFQDEKSA